MILYQTTPGLSNLELMLLCLLEHHLVLTKLCLTLDQMVLHAIACWGKGVLVSIIVPLTLHACMPITMPTLKSKSWPCMSIQDIWLCIIQAGYILSMVYHHLHKLW